MSLRSTILRQSIPLLPIHSFTRQTLALALTTLPKSDPSYRAEPLEDSVIDTIFGHGPVASKVLVDAWQDAGRDDMISAGPSGTTLKIPDMLEKRLEWSAELGEHLVEAYALLSTPSSTPSVPIPTIPLPLKQLLSFRLPPLYTPPNVRALHGTLSTTSDILSAISERTGGRLPLLHFNPLGPLAYAWNIADEALYQVEKATPVKKGVMNEPVGAGSFLISVRIRGPAHAQPEYYTSRVGLALAYLSAESHLLQPLPVPGQVPNPHMSLAVMTLRRNLEWYESASRSIQDAEKGAGDMMGFLDYIGKSWRGLIKSRYW